MHFALFIYLFLEIEFSSFSRYFCSLLFLFSAANKAHIAFASMYVCVCLRTAQCKRKVNVSVDVAVNVSRRSAALLLFVLSCCFLAAVVVFVRMCVCVSVFFIASVLLIRLPSCTQRVCLCVWVWMSEYWCCAAAAGICVLVWLHFLCRRSSPMRKNSFWQHEICSFCDEFTNFRNAF